MDLPFKNPYWCLYNKLLLSRWFTSLVQTIFSRTLENALTSEIGR